MANLLESRLVWGGFSWVCLLAFSLWFIALLFPVQDSPGEPPFDAVEPQEKDGAPDEAHNVFHQKGNIS